MTTTADDKRADPALKNFKWDHLPENLQAISRPFADLAHHLNDKTPRCEQRSVAFQKLLEAKDAAVRAVAIP